MIRFALLASGSKGNCLVLQSGETKIMIDCGTTGRYLKQSFSDINLSKEELNAVLITHDHSDHISQIRHFQDLNIYAPVEIPDIDSFMVRPLQKFNIGTFLITPIALSHDAVNTTGYILDDNEEKLVYITDTGYVNERYFPLLRDADYIILESNHDTEMLMHTRRPQYLKARICSDQGHLNNEQCADVLDHIVTKRTKMIVLAHISQEANTRQLALKTIVDTLSAHPDKSSSLIVAAAGQYEIIRKGLKDEKVDPGSCSCIVGMEHLA